MEFRIYDGTFAAGYQAFYQFMSELDTASRACNSCTIISFVYIESGTGE